MESFSIKNLSFSYPGQKGLILDNINLTVSKGEFLVLCGPSGCGKTTLLRQLKTVLAPYGIKSGEIYFEGTLLEDLNHRQQSENIGFVSQNPDNQIVTDKVWHELAFGLESLGYDTPAIRLRVAEMASFFGIENWFHKDVSELSGGQKQLLSLASIMAMQPSVLILDEPASQLDPIVASEFIEIIGKINREIGTTIILTEHRLEDTMALADRVLVMDKGKIIADGTPKEVGQAMSRKNHKMFLAMPVPMRIYASVENQLSCPVTVREGREWLDEFSKFNPLKVIEENNEIIANENKVALELDEVWFRYKKELPDVVKGASIKVSEGEFLSILGGNGTGKSTVLSLISGINKPYRGKIRIYGDELHNISDEEKFNGLLGILPQNSRTLFAKKTVKLDLYEIFKGQKLSEEEKQNRLKKVANICDIAELMGRHPYDLSEGERQRAALAKVLLLRPEILLLDEPTRGMDAEFKQKFAVILKKLLEKKVTIIMVSHDIEFCAKYTERAALFFDGGIVTEGRTGEFFSGNSFYTTAANRLSRHILPGAIVADDIIKACGGKILPDIDIDPDEHENGLYDEEDIKIPDLKEEKQSDLQVEKDKGHLSKRTATAAILILLLIPLTIYFGMFYLGNRKYYFISLLIILETMLPFVMIFEGKKPRPRELVIISVLCAFGVAGRAVFFMLPQFKPVIAMVVIAGVAFGGESGFLVGAMTMFLSNILYGQGPWTPWQMFAMGIIGFLAGILFQKGLLRPNRISLSIFGGIAAIFIYGGIMNPASVIIFQSNINRSMIVSSWIMGVPFDLVHGAATMLFLILMGEPMLEKLERIKIKYGIM